MPPRLHLFPGGVESWTAEKTEKALNAHGVSIIEIKRGKDRDDDRPRRRWSNKDSDWHVVRRSKYARRITGQTPSGLEGRRLETIA